MKNNKKAFTLIELLAVIIILAIIALIAVPTIMNIISKARKSSYKDSAYGIIKAGELYYSERLLDQNSITGEEGFDFENDLSSILPIKGRLPQNGKMLINGKGEIALALKYDELYCIRKGYQDVEVTIDNDLENCVVAERMPNITLNGESTTYVEINTIYNDLGATATSYDGNDLTSQIVTTNNVNTSVLGSNTITYSITAEGKTVTLNRTVIVRDTTAPVLIVPENTIISASVNTFDVMEGVGATDNSGETITVVPSSNISFGIPGEYTVTYTATDSSGNTTTETRTIAIEYRKPAIVLNGESTVYVEVNTTYNELGATAQTPQGADLTSNIITTVSGSGNTINTSVIGNQYTVTYSITDQGETTTTSRTVIVRDTIAPTLTVPGNTIISASVNTFDVMEGVSATDNSGETITVIPSSNISFGIPGTYTVTYTATDSSNNTTTKTRTVIIEYRKPAIVLNGDSIIYVEVNTTYNELGATAQTPQGVDLTSNIITTVSGSGNTVNTSVVGNQYTVTYSVTNQGETSTITRTVIVRDTIAPTLTVPGDATITTDDSVFNLMTGVSGTDNSGVNPTITTSGSITFGTAGTYTVTYTAKDSSNNTTTKTRNIIVIQANYIDATLNGADPVVKTGMIPVNIAPNGTVTKAGTNSEWYNYSQKKWANVVTVTESSRANYMNASAGTTIQEADILTYLVWVPRYKYKLWNVGTTNPSKTTHSIEITFENKDTTKSNGNTNGTYLTHPAFTFGTEELNGIWVGKFETGYKGATSASGAEQNTTNSAQVVIKPNTYSWRSITVSNAFNTVIGMNGANNAFGLDGAADTHMMKNTEWGAVAYLSHSTYGKNGEVYINNSNTLTTGCGANGASDPVASGCLNAYGSKSDNVYNQSTTGNISGVFDMSGGAEEYVMGYTTGAVACNGTFGDCSGFTTSTFPASKYVDTYSSTTNTDYTKRKLGDATGEMGTFSSNRGSWYSDYAYFIDSTYPWFVRGGYYNNISYDNTTAGVFHFSYDYGIGYRTYSFRVIIA